MCFLNYSVSTNSGITRFVFLFIGQTSELKDQWENGVKNETRLSKYEGKYQTVVNIAYSRFAFDLRVNM